MIGRDRAHRLEGLPPLGQRVDERRVVADLPAGRPSSSDSRVAPARRASATTASGRKVGRMRPAGSDPGEGAMLCERRPAASVVDRLSTRNRSNSARGRNAGDASCSSTRA